jgi:RHS repeat-associated protein
VFDALNRPLQISEGGRLTDYYYDLAGRAVGLMSGNDQWSVNEYDAQSRLVRRTLKANASGWNPLLAELTFAYDALGNLRRQQESWPGDIARVGVRSTTLSYDSGDRLRQELVQDDSGQKSTDYHYDGVGNRTLKLERTNGVLQKQTSYTSNVRNQLTSWEEENGSGIDLRSAALGYDVAGNRTSQALTTHGPVPSTANTSYAWDYDNRLTGVTLPGSLTHSYVYDYRTRRLQRSEPGNNPVAMTFSGGLSVAEFEVIDSQLGTLNSQPSVEYQRGPDMGGGVGGLLYSLRSGTAKYNLSNGRGDVVAQSDASGDLTWTASYEAYGKRPVETGSNLDRQRANTKEEDPTGLLNEGFRYRDLETGTWLSRDPAGFVDGPNLYAYVRQNPWTAFDPDGLRWKGIFFGKCIIIGGIGGFTTHDASESDYLDCNFPDYKEAGKRVDALKRAPFRFLKGAAGGYLGTDWGSSTEEGNKGRAVGENIALAEAVISLGRTGKAGLSGPSGPNAVPAGAGGGSVAPVAIPTAVPAPLIPANTLFQQSEESQQPTEGAKTVTTPNAKMRENANVRGTYVDPLTGNTVTASGNLAADHVVPKDWIKQQPGFSGMTPQQQSWLLNHPLNTQGLPTTFNSSKGAKMPGEWKTYKGQPLDPNYIENDSQRATFLQGFFRQKIDEMGGIR